MRKRVPEIQKQNGLIRRIHKQCCQLMLFSLEYYSSKTGKPAETCRNPQKPAKTCRNPKNPQKSAETCRILQTSKKPAEICRKLQKPAETCRNPQKPAETRRNLQKPAETCRNLQNHEGSFALLAILHFRVANTGQTTNVFN